MPDDTVAALCCRTVLLRGVDPSWAALPTLSHGKSERQIKLSGPTFYRQNIAAALARYGPLVTAELSRTERRDLTEGRRAPLCYCTTTSPVTGCDIR